MALTGLAIASALGLAKSELIDKQKEARDRALAATTQRLSPWTGLKANEIKAADPFGTALQYGATGASLGQNYANNTAYNNALAGGMAPAGGGAQFGVAPGSTASMYNGGNPWSMGQSNSIYAPFQY